MADGRLSPDEARAMLNRGAVVVDVRSKLEFDAAHHPGVLHLPMHLVPLVASERLPADRPLLVCCDSGARSAMTAQYLRTLGFEAHDLGAWTRHPDHS